MNDTLKECPFCGGAGELIWHSSDCWATGCTVCKAEGPVPAGSTESEAIAAWNARKSPRTDMGDGEETGWLIEENFGDAIHWIALSDEKWPQFKIRRKVAQQYITPLKRVKDANEALRFARKVDAEAFAEMFCNFLLACSVTEHSWPLREATDV